MLPAREPWTAAETHFVSSALQYYVSGRFAALAHQAPVAANLLHHAMEMLLKGALCRSHSREAIRLMGHNLRRPWKAFTLIHQVPELVALDAAVSALNKFERIRYPDELLSKGAVVTFDLFREHQSSSTSYTGSTPPRYKLNLEDVDELMVLIFRAGNMNPAFYLYSMDVKALAVLHERNRHPLAAA